MKSIVIYNYKLANQLLKRGFIINEILPNKNAKGILVFYFQRSPRLEKVLTEEYGVKIG